jgi:hypothetical protein
MAGEYLVIRLDDHYAEQKGQINMFASAMFQGVEDNEVDAKASLSNQMEFSSIRAQLYSLQQHLEEVKEKGF